MASASATLRKYGELPYGPDSGAYGLSTSNVSTQLIASLPAGAYQFYNDADVVCVVRLGSPITSLKPAAREASQWAIPPGGACNVAVPTATSLYAQLASGAGSLYVNNPAAGSA